MTYDIYIYGNGEVLWGIFNALAMCLNAKSGSLYEPLLRLGMIVGALWAVVYVLYQDIAKLFTSWILPMTVFTTILFVPTATVTIHDPITRFHQAVDNVPYGLAMFAGYVSKIGHNITEQVEKVFSLPDDLKYQSTGYIFASHLMQKSNQFRITNADFADNMYEFVNQCVVSDLRLGRKYTLNDLKKSDDIWGVISANASPVRSFMWRDIKEEGQQGGMARLITCKEGVAKFNVHWKKAIDESATLFGKKLFGARVDAKAELLKYLPLSLAPLDKMGQDATKIIQQQLMISSFVSGIDQHSVAQGNAANFAVRRAYLGQRSTYQTLGALAGDNLPILKAVLESLTYASFLFIIFLAVLPFGWRFLLSWGQIVVWLQLWAPLYAVLNYVMTIIGASKTAAAMSIQGASGVTLATSVAVLDINADINATAGFLSLSVPFISYALLKGVGSFISLASHLGQISQGAASAAASDALSGNYSFGNISEGGRQIGNTQMYHQSMAASYRAGSFNLADGRTEITTMGDGSQLMNVGSSNLPVSLSFAESQSSQYSTMANQSYQKALNLSESSNQSLSSSYRDMVDLSKAIGNSHHASDAISQGHSTESSRAIQQSANMIQSFADQNNISYEKAASLFAEASMGGKLGALAGSVGGRASVTSSDVALLQKAQNVVESEDFQKAYRAATQAAKNYSHNLSDEESRRLAESVSGSYEKGLQQREEAAKSFSQAESYNKQAMETQANSASINSNYNQRFVEWLTDQKADGTQGRIGSQGAAHIIANDPEMVRMYANRFMQEQNILPKSSVSLSAQSLKQSYDQETGHTVHAVTKESIAAVKHQGETQITTDRIDRKELFEGSVNQQIAQHHKSIAAGESSIAIQREETANKYNETT
ncbi:conjugal transfer protein TraG N-terminal domain-containing protein [Candidatus Odyssella thessalonicensis]|uniref:conjugal transfer protein TraG N-terminal domain-containing protein n=1 Tax=Candidatus Odyssella thessalonicensis TaxID=84647 RepID=UPI000225AF7D|nr:conjugal transfer protein TraG N-terminal domain-containing protein [Candidatus Odyssella thessalonicensis]